jgi:hypothetical protein
MAANALLVATDKIHSQEPLDKWQFGVLEDCTNKAREVLTTSLATELTILANNAMVSTTIRAYNVTIRPTAFDDGLLALIVRGEVRCERNDAVEFLEVYHILEVFLFKIYYKDTLFQLPKPCSYTYNLTKIATFDNSFS